jgi:ribosomal protein S18 acetylase RimI-like enzyme
VEILALAPEAEGRGIARVLMQAAEDWSREQGYSRVTLNVFATNQRALGLYEHLGYRPETVHYLKDLS